MPRKCGLKRADDFGGVPESFDADLSSTVQYFRALNIFWQCWRLRAVRAGGPLSSETSEFGLLNLFHVVQFHQAERFASQLRKEFDAIGMEKELFVAFFFPVLRHRFQLAWKCVRADALEDCQFRYHAILHLGRMRSLILGRSERREHDRG